MNGCIMCDSLYVKANGELPCWDDVGEELVFRTLNLEKLQRGLDPGIFHSPELLHIRESFLRGEYPHPGMCERCAVRDHGSAQFTLHPKIMPVLHLEASYLCHLSCPQCIPASLRHDLKAAPYHMTVPLLDALLQQLQREGVEGIRMVHFEGRGDPLMNPWMDQLVKLAKMAYPDALTKVTTHGSYPYKPWIVESGLDLLRVSIDGAFPASYEKYRVGGSLEVALEFLRQIRDERRRLRGNLQVEWKYILFEWNDTEEEMRHAARLAENLDVRLRFTLTHSPGKSNRFPDQRSLQEALRHIAPDAAVDVTFQLKEADEPGDVNSVVAEHVAAQLVLAIEAIRKSDEQTAVVRIEKALQHDPGGEARQDSPGIHELVKRHVGAVLTNAKFPSTVSTYAAVCSVLGFQVSSMRLLRRYLRLVPNAMNREAVLSQIRAERALAVSNSMVRLRNRIRLRTRLRQFAHFLTDGPAT